MPNRPFSFISAPTIREAVEADATALASLMGELGYPVTPSAMWARVKRLSGRQNRTLVAEIDGKIAGFVGFSALEIYESEVPTCWVMALAVAAPFRRHGVGKALLDAVEKWCAEAGLRDIRIHSGEQRGEAHAFYEVCGFKRAGIRFKKTLS